MSEIKVVDLLHAESDHHILGASAAERWMTCPGSVKASIGLPDTETDAAREGSIAHDYCEALLHCYLDTDGAAANLDTLLDQIEDHDPEMKGHVLDYGDYVMNVARNGGRVWVEQKIDLGRYIPGGFGRADAVVYQPDDQTLHMIDFKYGKGIAVPVEHNKQMMIYALGVLNTFRGKKNFPIRRVMLHIHQPRKFNVCEWEVEPETLKAFAADVMIAVEKCVADDPEFNPSPKACQFCRAQATCPALYDYTKAMIWDEFDQIPQPVKLSNDKLAEIYEAKKLIESFLKSVESHMFAEVESGRGFPGYKMVEGRSVRRWADHAENILIAEIGEEAFVKKLKNLTDVERHLGKKRFAELDLTVKPPGKPTMAKEDDKRPAINTGSTDDFEVLEAPDK